MMDFDVNTIFHLPKKQQILLFLGLFIVIFFAGYFFDIKSQRMNLQEVESQEIELKSQLDLALLKEVNLKNNIDSQADVVVTLKKWKSSLIKYTELPEAMNQILKLGADNNITFSLFKPLAEVKAGSYMTAPIEVIAVGSYHQLANFISQVANFPRMMVLNSFSFSNENLPDVLGAKLAGHANAGNLLTARIMFEIYIISGQNKP